MPQIYFDNQSTTPISDEVIQEIKSVLSAKFANPSSQHEFGRLARLELERFRSRIGNLLGLARNDKVIFTSGGTESNNLAILGHFPAGLEFSQTNVVCSAIEHPSVLAVMEELKQRSVEIRMVQPNSLGRIQTEQISSAIDSQTRLVCCMWANNETGIIQPVGEIASVCTQKQIPLHVDAVQGVGKLPFEFGSMGCSSATVSPHKFHGPTGIGILLLRSDCQVSPLFWGGFQQEGIRPGTENLSLIAGCSRALDLAVSNLDKNVNYVKAIRNRFETSLLAQIPDMHINGDLPHRLPNASNISFLGVDRQQFIMAADMAGLACSTGSACSSGSSQPSHVLTSMGSEKSIVDSAIRFGFSPLNRPEEVDRAVEIIKRILSLKTSQNHE